MLRPPVLFIDVLKQFWTPQHLCKFRPPSQVLFPPPQAERREDVRWERRRLASSSSNSHARTHKTHYTHLLTSLVTARLLSQCPRQGRCPLIWTKPERGDSLDLISKLLHQFISIHTTEQPRALPPTPCQQFSSSFRNLCPNASLKKKTDHKTESKGQDLSAYILKSSSLIMTGVLIFFLRVRCSFSLHFCKTDPHTVLHFTPHKQQTQQTLYVSSTYSWSCAKCNNL